MKELLAEVGLDRAVEKKLDWFSMAIEKVKFRDIFFTWAGTMVVFGIVFSFVAYPVACDDWARNILCQ